MENWQRAALCGAAASQWLSLRLQTMAVCVCGAAAVAAVMQRQLHVADAGIYYICILNASSRWVSCAQWRSLRHKTLSTAAVKCGIVAGIVPSEEGTNYRPCTRLLGFATSSRRGPWKNFLSQTNLEPA